MRKFAILFALSMFLGACSLIGQSESTAPDDDAPPNVETTMADLGGMCGGIAGIQCAEEMAYCALEAGACVSIADAAGVCQVKPEICTMEYMPVCGCDGKTYSNGCAAAAAGVSVAAEGACPEAG